MGEDIGKKRREITIEPIEEPVREPMKVPEREKVPAPVMPREQ